MALGRRMFQTMASRPPDQSTATAPGAALLAKIPQTVLTGTTTAPTLTAIDSDASRIAMPNRQVIHTPRVGFRGAIDRGLNVMNAHCPETRWRGF